MADSRRKGSGFLKSTEPFSRKNLQGNPFSSIVWVFYDFAVSWLGYWSVNLYKNKKIIDK
ncbi:hypothetical protein J7E95_14020 [Streptomyces sp. ISL-14]|nr:hypothetical protein [Streptomyces sp. ISL-14]